MQLNTKTIARINAYLRSYLKLEPADMSLDALVNHIEKIKDHDAKAVISQLADNITYLMSLEAVRAVMVDETKTAEMLSLIAMLQTSTKEVVANAKELKQTCDSQLLEITNLKKSLEAEAVLRKKYQRNIALALKYYTLNGEEVFANPHTTVMAEILNKE